MFPDKKSCFIYCVFFLLGCGSLIPWHVIITATSYYDNRFCGTKLEGDVINYLTTSFTALQITGVGYVVLYQNVLPLNQRVLTPLYITASLFFLTSLLVLFPLDPYVFFGITILSTGICGICTAVLNSGLLSMTSMLPNIYTSAVMSGQGFAGVAISGIKVASLLPSPPADIGCVTDDDYHGAPVPPWTNNLDNIWGSPVSGLGQECHYQVDWSSLGYFSMAFLILAMCIYFYKQLQQMVEIKRAIFAYRLRHAASLMVMRTDSSRSLGRQHSSKGLKAPSTSKPSPITSPMFTRKPRGPSQSLLMLNSDTAVAASPVRNSYIRKNSFSHVSDNGSRQSRISPDALDSDDEEVAKALSSMNCAEAVESGTALVRRSVQDYGSVNSTGNPNTDMFYVGMDSTQKSPALSPEPSPFASPFDSPTGSPSNTRASSPVVEGSEEVLFQDIFRVIKSVFIPGISVWLVFFVTIGIFPALVVHLQSVHRCIRKERLFNDLFTPFLFTLLNFFDFFGRLLTSMIPALFTEKNIWTISVARLVMFPLFLACNLQGTRLPVLFAQDEWPILFVMILGLSSGYIASLAMMLGPAVVHPKDAAPAGTIMLVFLTVGIVCGSSFSFVVTYISTGSF